MADLGATPDIKTALLMDEICVEAVAELQACCCWTCSALQFAQLLGGEIIAKFSPIDGLVLGDGPHGFALHGAPGVIHINDVQVTLGRKLQLTMNTTPAADTDLMLAYAWSGNKNPALPDYVANYGLLRDHWTYPSTVLPEHMLFQYALPRRLPVVHRFQSNVLQ